ncbi:6101_t:CDS:2 [Ambispora gerdemannii]|uniref:6101_t:CDS:1 n=1 Tax=Ambispora gerdemannii TaxID=144530 RepID=A0A9N9BLM4_9GLOM|nr:6101_t:CDS:2 [Ambispora gerdemannii]
MYSPFKNMLMKSFAENISVDPLKFEFPMLNSDGKSVSSIWSEPFRPFQNEPWNQKEIWQLKAASSKSNIELYRAKTHFLVEEFQRVTVSAYLVRKFSGTYYFELTKLPQLWGPYSHTTLTDGRYDDFFLDDITHFGVKLLLE